MLIYTRKKGRERKREGEGEYGANISDERAYHATAAALGYARAYRNTASIDLRGEATVCLEIMPMYGREKINLLFAHARDGHALLFDVLLTFEAQQ